LERRTGISWWQLFQSVPARVGQPGPPPHRRARAPRYGQEATQRGSGEHRCGCRARCWHVTSRATTRGCAWAAPHGAGNRARSSHRRTRPAWPLSGRCRVFLVGHAGGSGTVTRPRGALGGAPLPAPSKNAAFYSSAPRQTHSSEEVYAQPRNSTRGLPVPQPPLILLCLSEHQGLPPAAQRTHLSTVRQLPMTCRATCRRPSRCRPTPSTDRRRKRARPEPEAQQQMLHLRKLSQMNVGRRRCQALHNRRSGVWCRRHERVAQAFRLPRLQGLVVLSKCTRCSVSVDSTLRLLDLGDEGRFPLMSHVWRLDNRDESRERRSPGRDSARLGMRLSARLIAARQRTCASG
jgi:hypothetical protein